MCSRLHQAKARATPHYGAKDPPKPSAPIVHCCPRLNSYQYIDLLVRINQAIGSLELTKIRPQHLNALYSDLKENGVRADTDRAVATRAPKTTLHEMEIFKAKLSRMAGVAASTITNVTRGDPIRIDKAEAIAAALECDFDELFKVEENRTPLSDKTILEHHLMISTILAQAEKEMLIH